MKDEITIQSRTSYSLAHIRSAIFFTSQALLIEEGSNKDLLSEYTSFCSSSTILTVAFLEATINEFYCNINDNIITEKNDKIPQKNLDSIKRLWTLEIPKTASYNILQKYHIAFALCDKPPIDKKDSLYANITSLIKLRNALIHFEPQWTDITTPEKAYNHKFYLQTKNQFPLNPFTKGHSFFPDQCIGHGCAKWGIDNALKFVDQFYEVIDIKAPYHYFKEKQLNRYRF